GGDKASTPMPLRAGESARLTFQAPASCDGAGRVLPTQHYRGLEVDLDGRPLALPALEPVLCDDHFAGKTIVGFPPKPPTPGTVASLAAHIEEPVASVAAGEKLQYVVVLTNTTGTAVDLSTSCPVFTQIVSTGTATETHSYKL